MCRTVAVPLALLWLLIGVSGRLAAAGDGDRKLSAEKAGALVFDCLCPDEGDAAADSTECAKKLRYMSYPEDALQPDKLREVAREYAQSQWSVLWRDRLGAGEGDPPTTLPANVGDDPALRWLQTAKNLSPREVEIALLLAAWNKTVPRQCDLVHRAVHCLGMSRSDFRVPELNVDAIRQLLEPSSQEDSQESERRLLRALLLGADEVLPDEVIAAAIRLPVAWDPRWPPWQTSRVLEWVFESPAAGLPGAAAKVVCQTDDRSQRAALLYWLLRPCRYETDAWPGDAEFDRMLDCIEPAHAARLVRSLGYHIRTSFYPGLGERMFQPGLSDEMGRALVWAFQLDEGMTGRILESQDPRLREEVLRLSVQEGAPRLPATFDPVSYACDATKPVAECVLAVRRIRRTAMRSGQSAVDDKGLDRRLYDGLKQVAADEMLDAAIRQEASAAVAELRGEAQDRYRSKMQSFEDRLASMAVRRTEYERRLTRERPGSTTASMPRLGLEATANNHARQELLIWKLRLLYERMVPLDKGPGRVFDTPEPDPHRRELEAVGCRFAILPAKPPAPQQLPTDLIVAMGKYDPETPDPSAAEPAPGWVLLLATGEVQLPSSEEALRELWECSNQARQSIGQAAVALPSPEALGAWPPPMAASAPSQAETSPSPLPRDDREFRLHRGPSRDDTPGRLARPGYCARGPKLEEYDYRVPGVNRGMINVEVVVHPREYAYVTHDLIGTFVERAERHRMDRRNARGERGPSEVPRAEAIVDYLEWRTEGGTSPSIICRHRNEPLDSGEPMLAWYHEEAGQITSVLIFYAQLEGLPTKIIDEFLTRYPSSMVRNDPAAQDWVDKDLAKWIDLLRTRREDDHVRHIAEFNLSSWFKREFGFVGFRNVGNDRNARDRAYDEVIRQLEAFARERAQAATQPATAPR